VTPDDPEQRLERLFRAARAEKPGSDARKAALERAVASTRGRSRRRGVTFGVVFAAAAGLVLALGLGRARDTRLRVSAEPLPPAAHPNPIPELPAHPPVPAPAASATQNPDASSTPHRDKPPIPRPAPTLGEEIATLQAARTALDAGDAKHALAVLDHYARAVPGARLGDEATVIRLEALSGVGRRAEASELAREFVAKHPGSPLVDRARAFIAPLATSAAPQPSADPGEKP
jgi:hypothetical protein